MVEDSVLFEILQKFSGARVLCVGDVMLDRFVYGAVDRISPEAPIPVFSVAREKLMPGGAGNVVANIAALGGTATLVSIAGADKEMTDLTTVMQDLGIDFSIETPPGRRTTTKSRFISGGQQMLRVDHEDAELISEDAAQKIIARAEQAMPAAQAVILSDYKKGLLTDAVIAGVISAARAQGVPVIVDPKGQDFRRYRGASVITPNRKELEAATGMKAGTDEELRAAAMKVIIDCGIPAVLATRSQDGMSLITADAEPLHIPAQVREIFDVSGAGDTVIAAFAAALATGASLRNAAFLSNIAAGIAVGKPGTATVRPDEITAALGEGVQMGKYAARNKHVSAAAAADQAEKWRIRGFKVGFTNGCFDLLHPGHLSSLRQAKAACDYLVVAINSDASVRKLKGPSRPVQDETARAAILSALEMIDLVVVFDADTPLDLIRTIRPDVLIKGGQYKLEDVVGYDVVMSYGGKILRAEMEDGFSTTNTIGRIAESA